MKQSLYLIFLISLVAACKLPVYTPSTLPSERLVFGYGGGFNPKPVEFIMLKNGQIFTTGLSQDTIECLSIKKSVAKVAFNNYYTAFNALKGPGTPENVYRFIDLQKDTTSKRYVWSNKSYDKNIDSLYHVMKKLVQFPQVPQDSTRK